MAKSTVLITGGAGYIGSHAVIAFREGCYGTVVLDNLTTGTREAVPEGVPFAEGETGDVDLVGHLIRKYSIDAVVHFAGSVVVPESVSDPLKYYRNNTCTSRNLMEAWVTHKVNYLIFSSTAAVYGIPQTIPVSEASPVAPINPYGASKLMTEWILKDTASAQKLSLVLNCGYGRGYTVREVLSAVERECGKKLDIRSPPRRTGDPPALVADVTELRKHFEWEPKYNDLGMIVRTALRWEQKTFRTPSFDSPIR